MRIREKKGGAKGKAKKPPAKLLLPAQLSKKDLPKVYFLREGRKSKRGGS